MGQSFHGVKQSSRRAADRIGGRLEVCLFAGQL
jgi:hypothetical protein